MFPTEVFVNCTANGAVPDVILAENDAEGLEINSLSGTTVPST